MRCPNCQERNSVASRKCYKCSYQLPRKPLPSAIKISLALIILTLVLAVIVFKSAVTCNKFTNDIAINKNNQSEQDWSNLKIKIESFLNTRTTLNLADLDSQLKSFLSEYNCETHIFEISHCCKIVEVSKNLYSALFVVVSNKPKIVCLNRVNIFKDARILESNKQQLLIILGHSSSVLDRKNVPSIINLETLEDLTNQYLPHLPEKISFSFAANDNFLHAQAPILQLLQSEGLDSSSVIKFDFNNNQLIDCLFKPAPNGSLELFADWSKYSLGPIYQIIKAIEDPSKIANLMSNSNKRNLKSISENIKLANSKLGNQPLNFSLELTGKKVKNNCNISIFTIEINDTSLFLKIDGIKSNSKQTQYFIEDLILDKNAQKNSSEIQINNEKELSNSAVNQNTKNIQENKTVNSSQNNSLTDIKQSSNQNTQPTQISQPVNNESLPKEVSQMGYAATKINIRANPSTSSKVLSYLPANGRIKIVEFSGGWYKVKLKNGNLGYIYGPLLKTNLTKSTEDSKKLNSANSLRIKIPQFVP